MTPYLPRVGRKVAASYNLYNVEPFTDNPPYCVNKLKVQKGKREVVAVYLLDLVRN